MACRGAFRPLVVEALIRQTGLTRMKKPAKYNGMTTLKPKNTGKVKAPAMKKSKVC